MLRRRLPRSVDQDELTSDGQLGLLIAAGRFDPTRGVPFRAYAYPRVLGAMIDGLRRRAWGRRVAGVIGRREELDPDGRSVPDPEFARIDAMDETRTILTGLPVRRREVLEMYYLDEMSLRAIAQVLRVTESRLSQLLGSARRAARERETNRRAA